ncbi:hypothetical protein [Propionivibrio sp.]|uniref:hypothetical protein n=1 Tax=Propionivibrio sp. TaxID=2212460 RepID=UPI003BEF6C0B
MLFQSDNPILSPTNEQTKVLQTLKDSLGKDSGRAKVSDAGIRSITLQQVPDAYDGFVSTVQKLFGVRIQFVRAQGLTRGIEFSGDYRAQHSVS